MVSPLVIGTRASKLAVWQAEHVKKLLHEKCGVSCLIKTITTKGDTILDRSLVDVGGKGLFIKEIEDELLAGTIDIAVHSMKDVPHTLDKGLTIAAILEREDPSDSFVSRKYLSISEMSAGAVVGTSSLRRMIQLKELYPHLKYEVLRGNVDTRIKKLEAGQYDAIILASAGLIRLGLAHEIKERLPIVPGVGQGALGIECCGIGCRRAKEWIIDLIQCLDHGQTSRAINLERYFAKKIDASCQMAVGCLVRGQGSGDRGQGFVIDCFWEKDGVVRKEHREGKWEDGEKIVEEMCQ
jgi:hydroxymethylbilane synthase